MSTKMKAFIGILVSFVILIILFTSTGGYRAARAVEEKKTETCSVEEKVVTSETVAQAEAKQGACGKSGWGICLSLIVAGILFAAGDTAFSCPFFSLEMSETHIQT